MKVAFDTLWAKTFDYALANVLPAVEPTMDKFLIGIALGAKSADAKAALHSLGAMDDAGDVDLDALSSALEAGFKCVPDGKLRVTHGLLKTALVFSKADWETLRASLEK